MPRCQARWRSGAACPCPHLIKLFPTPRDLYRAAVVQHQNIAVGQQHRLRQIDHNLVTLAGGQLLAAQVAVGPIEHDGAEWSGIAGMGVGNGAEQDQPSGRKFGIEDVRYGKRDFARKDADIQPRLVGSFLPRRRILLGQHSRWMSF